MMTRGQLGTIELWLFLPNNLLWVQEYSVRESFQYCLCICVTKGVCAAMPIKFKSKPKVQIFLLFSVCQASNFAFFSGPLFVVYLIYT